MPNGARQKALPAAAAAAAATTTTTTTPAAADSLARSTSEPDLRLPRAPRPRYAREGTPPKDHELERGHARTYSDDHDEITAQKVCRHDYDSDRDPDDRRKREMGLHAFHGANPRREEPVDRDVSGDNALASTHQKMFDAQEQPLPSAILLETHGGQSRSTDICPRIDQNDDAQAQCVDLEDEKDNPKGLYMAAVTGLRRRARTSFNRRRRQRASSEYLRQVPGIVAYGAADRQPLVGFRRLFKVRQRARSLTRSLVSGNDLLGAGDMINMHSDTGDRSGSPSIDQAIVPLQTTSQSDDGAKSRTEVRAIISSPKDSESGSPGNSDSLTSENLAMSLLSDKQSLVRRRRDKLKFLEIDETGKSVERCLRRHDILSEVNGKVESSSTYKPASDWKTKGSRAQLTALSRTAGGLHNLRSERERERRSRVPKVRPGALARSSAPKKEIDAKSGKLTHDGKSSPLALTMRDLRQVDPAFVAKATLWVRERCMVVSFEPVRAIILHDRMLVFDFENEEAKKPIQYILQRLAYVSRSGEDAFTPFEFRALEGIFIYSCMTIERNFHKIERCLLELLRTLPPHVSPIYLERLRLEEQSLNTFSGHVRKFQNVLQTVLDTDEDMANMYLTEKHRSSKSWRNPMDHDEAEGLLESYLQVVDDLTSRADLLDRAIDGTEDVIDIQLDTKQIHLLKNTIRITMALMLIMFATSIFGIFAMNLPLPQNMKELPTSQYFHYATVVGTVGTVGVAVVLVTRWCHRQGQGLYNRRGGRCFRASARDIDAIDGVISSPTDRVQGSIEFSNRYPSDVAESLRDSGSQSNDGSGPRHDYPSKSIMPRRKVGSATERLLEPSVTEPPSLTSSGLRLTPTLGTNSPSGDVAAPQLFHRATEKSHAQHPSNAMNTFPRSSSSPDLVALGTFQRARSGVEAHGDVIAASEALQNSRCFEPQATGELDPEVDEVCRSASLTEGLGGKDKIGSIAMPCVVSSMAHGSDVGRLEAGSANSSSRGDYRTSGYPARTAMAGVRGLWNRGLYGCTSEQIEAPTHNNVLQVNEALNIRSFAGVGRLLQACRRTETVAGRPVFVTSMEPLDVVDNTTSENGAKRLSTGDALEKALERGVSSVEKPREMSGSGSNVSEKQMCFRRRRQHELKILEFDENGQHTTRHLTRQEVLDMINGNEGPGSLFRAEGTENKDVKNDTRSLTAVRELAQFASDRDRKRRGYNVRNAALGRSSLTSGLLRNTMRGGRQQKSRLALTMRDMRQVDPSFTAKTVLWVRENCILVSLENVRAIILRNAVLLFDPDNENVQKLIPNISQRLSFDVKNSEDAFLPFEFRALEGILEHSCARVEHDFYAIEKDLLMVLETLPTYSGPESLERLRLGEQSLNHFFARIRTFQYLLQTVLDTDEDMANMYLTEKYKAPEARKSPMDHEEAEMLLESYLQVVDDVTSRAGLLNQAIDDTEHLIEINLDTKQNQLLQVTLRINLLSTIFGFGTAVTGIFGMMLPLPDVFLNLPTSQYFFYATVVSCLALSVLAAVVVSRWSRRLGHGLYSQRHKWWSRLWSS